MLFNQIKEINGLSKEIIKLLRNGMSNIYLKVSYHEEKVTFAKLQFSMFKKFFTRFVLGSSNPQRSH